MHGYDATARSEWISDDMLTLVMRVCWILMRVAIDVGERWVIWVFLAIISSALRGWFILAACLVIYAVSTY